MAKLIRLGRLFDLFMELGVPLKEYYMSSVDEYGYESSPSRYNDITKVLSTKEEEALVTKIDDYDPFEVAEKNGGPVPNKWDCICRSLTSH